jgi:GTP-binding protein
MENSSGLVSSGHVEDVKTRRKTMEAFRNLAIIAHVDHGKTTLVDALLKQAGTFRTNQAVADRAMDSNDLEKERGITILAKCTSVAWGDFRLNIVDTPGHADFGGEVERILSMVDGVVVLVDAAEGPMPQTKFVTAKALKLGLRPIVVVNKVDRPDARPDEVLDEVFDLFLSLEASEAQLDFPIIYASGRNGWATKDLDQTKEDLKDLFDTIVSHIPAPVADTTAPFSMLVTTLEYDPYLGRVLTGRVHSGVLKPNIAVKSMTHDGQTREMGRITKILAFRGLERVTIERAEAGDIIAIAGLEKTTVADTIVESQSALLPLPAQPIDPPTLAMTFSVNDSPLAGREGTKVTSRMIKDRLERESEGNISIIIRETPDKDAFEVAGRGELQLGVLIETMRREGYELSISRPRVLFQEIDSQRFEPIEEVMVDVDEEFSGVVVEKMSMRKGEMTDMRPSAGGKQRLTFKIPSRGLIGYQSEFLTDTRGTGIMSRLFHGYAPFKGTIEGRRNGCLISNSDGVAVAYALWNLEERGTLFIHPSTQVYQGMIIGENARGSDLEVNPLKGKQLTNIRAAGKDEAVRLTPPRIMSLEQAITYIEDDELVEITPKSIRLRKKYLDPHERKRAERTQS